MKKMCIYGHFGFGKELLNGQTVKTKIVAEEAANAFGEDEVMLLDTHGGYKKLIRLPFDLLKALKRCKNVVIMPAQNGVCIITPILVFLNLFFKRKLHYVVIGGWLPEYIRDKHFLTRCLKGLDCIYPETSTMRTALEELGFANVHVMPNCKRLPILKEEELVYYSGEPYRVCTFSRVMKEKGIEEAVNAVKTVNEKCGRVVYALDIYGPIDENSKEWFAQLRNDFPDYIKYCGSIPYDKSVETIRRYFALLFPTRFFTEGIPGSVIDAYAAGVPVIASKWENYADIIDEKTGVCYEFDNTDEFTNLLLSLSESPGVINEKRMACLEKAKCFQPQHVMQYMFEQCK